MSVMTYIRNPDDLDEWILEYKDANGISKSDAIILKLRKMKDIEEAEERQAALVAPVSRRPNESNLQKNTRKHNRSRLSRDDDRRSQSNKREYA